MTPLKDIIDRFEKNIILKVMRIHLTVSKSARIMGINRTTLIEKMRKHGIKSKVIERRLIIDLEGELENERKPEKREPETASES